MAFKAIFLDRDNTIIEDPGYINHPNQVKLLPGTTSALSDMRKMGYKLIIVSNQSGVARGIVTEEMLSEIHQRLIGLLRSEGVMIDGIYYCPFHPDGVIEKYRKESRLRKPSPGMLMLAAEEMDIDLGYSWMIGDSYRDIEAGKQAGCRTILINSPTNPTIKEYSDPEADSIAVNIKEAANIIKMCIRDGKLPFKVAKKRKVPNTRPAPEVETDTTTMMNQQSQAEAQQAQSETKMQSQQKETSTYPDALDDHNDNNTKQQTYIPEDNDYKRDDYREYDVHEGTYDESEDLTPEEVNTHLLRKIANRLGKHKQADMYEDFSMFKVFAGIVQIAVFFCLLISVWFMLDQTKEVSSVHTMIGYAIVFQLMAIAFYIMNWRK
ncbi:MAG: HAD family hydrolase [Planctomycetes bacterium]|nr:HAD family hydrolase [Planctomycetota bacterium]